ncbi:hypothetical protein CMI37_34400 [Candidatus Pacearchaeota archaeon]|nr:hypothetical protein [Candidatus Pacearchaeota archaeon]|tara:strand:+ start:672 stop:2789 length:2118 start_codon:yes stop_codon:yes gene_type:complete
MATANMSLNEPTVGTTTGPTWATETNSNWESIDAHDHTSGKGVQLTPSSLNINADVEFNLQSATELKNVVLDNTIHSSGSGDTNVSLYVYDGNFYYRNASGVGVQITSGSGVNTSGGSIDNMTTNAQVNFSSNSYAFKFDKTLSDPGMAKMSFADIDLYKYDASGSAAKVALKFLGTGTTAALTVPDETGTLLSTATSFAGAINIATSSTNYPINLKPNGTGHVVIGNTGATGKLTSNGAYDLILDTNSGTNSSSIAITDAANGNISFIPNGTGEIVIGSGSASGKITTNSTQDLVLDTNAGTNSGTITIEDGVNGEITFDTNGTGDINLTAGADINIPADIGLTFGNNGEKIEGNGTKLDISTAELDFTIEAGGDINIGADIGLTFGHDDEKIEGDGTDLSISSSGEININSGTLDLSAQTVDVTLNAAVDALNFDSNTLSIDASNNRIGIGMTAPDAELDVNGKVEIDAAAYNADALSIHHSAHAANRGLVMGQVSSDIQHISNQTDASDTGSIRINYVGYEGGTANFRRTHICDGKNTTIVSVDGSSQAVSVVGSFSKGSGSFKIDHPLESKSETHNLVHSFIEGPQADLIYRGKATLVNGEATINLDTVSNMTEGTFVLLNTNTQCFTSNESGFGEVKGSVSGNNLIITAKENTSTDTISWLVVGERHDPHMIETEWTDENGKVIVEPEKVVEPETNKEKE